MEVESDKLGGDIFEPFEEVPRPGRPMRLTIPKLRTWHLLGIVALSAGFLAVMEVLWKFKDPGYALIRQLRSSDAREREKAAMELIKLRPRERRAIAPLTEMLFDPDFGARASAARALKEIVDRADEAEAGPVKAALVAALGDRDPVARLAIVKSLCALNPEPRVVVPTLLEMARDRNGGTRANAIFLLSHYGRQSEPVLAALFAALGDADPEVRWRSAESLGFCSFFPNVPPEPLLGRIKNALLGVADDENPGVRAAGVSRLAAIASRAKADDPRVIEALGDPDSGVRLAAAASLGWNRPGNRSKDLVPALVRTLADPDFQVRQMSAKALGTLGVEGEVAIPALRASTNDPAESIREEATRAVEAIEKATAIRGTPGG